MRKLPVRMAWVMSKKTEDTPKTEGVISSWPNHLPEDGDRVITWENLKKLGMRIGLRRLTGVLSMLLRWLATAIFIAIAMLAGVTALVAITVLAVGTMLSRRDEGGIAWRRRKGLKRLQIPDTLRVLSTPLKWVAVAVLITMTLLAVGIMLTSCFGWDIARVANDSMGPELSVGDAIAYCTVETEDIEIGDVIAFRSPGDAIACRRVTDVRSNEISTVFHTKGDANREPDQGMVLAKNVEGRVAYCIPHLGSLVEFAGSGGGLVLLILVPGMLIVASEMKSISIVLSKRKRLLKGDSWLREAGLGGRSRTLAAAEEIDRLLSD